MMKWTRRARRFCWGLAFATAAQLHGVDEAKVIYPGAVAERPSESVPHPGGPSWLTLGGIILLAGAGGYFLWKNKTVRLTSPKSGRLAVDETKSLGNRQFLVVASYEGRKFLLGVCPGKIEMLAPLSAPVPSELERFSL